MLKFIDLFCGGGFGARGAVKGGGEPILAVDSWNIATQTYKANFPNAKVITERIEEINPANLELKDIAIDVLLTSPECTSHSIARGAKTGSEKSRETALGIVPWIETFNPRWVVVENVDRMKKWSRHNELISSIESHGYKISELVLNAADFGTPQSRKRLFLLCDLDGSSTTSQEFVNRYGQSGETVNHILVENNHFKSSPLYSERRAKATIEKAERAISTLGKGVPFLIVYYGSDYAGGWQRLDVPLRTITTVDRFGLVTWQGDIPFLRMLQPIELLKAMGAKKHRLPFGTRRDKVKLCGNGVCSPVMQKIFQHITIKTQVHYQKAVMPGLTL